MKPYVLLVIVIFGLIPLALFAYGYFHHETFVSSQESMRRLVASYGRLAPVAFVALQIAQVVIPPINQNAVGLAGGFLFGAGLGSVLNWIGRVIGHSGAFAIARYLARPWIARQVSPERMAQYDRYVSGNAVILGLLYLMPVGPDDDLSYVASASSMSWRTFLAANLLGQVGNSLGLALLGAGTPVTHPVAVVLIVLTLLATVVLIVLVGQQLRRRQRLS